MYRTETIKTKIRPLKKLCVIEDNDIDRLIQIIRAYSVEIGSILNIILINNDKLFLSNTIDFVNHHDPDIIINFSDCDDNKLRISFKTLVLNGKQEGFDLNQLATPIEILSNMPDFVKMMYERDEEGESIKSIYTNFDASFSRDRLIHSLNFGLMGHDQWEERGTLFEGTIFEQINLDNIRGGVFGPYGRLLRIPINLLGH